MELIISEKPSAAEKIAHSLGKPKEMRYKRVKYFLVGDKVILPAVGHLFSLKEKDISFPSLDLEWRPAYEVNRKLSYTKDYLDLISKFKDCEKFIVATDYDLEGDVIGANILKYLNKYEVGKRMKFSTLTKEELSYAYKNLEDINKLSVDAGETRHYVDWLYGINLSRFLMNLANRKLSIGRVQGPMLKFLVEREEEIEKFVPRDYWEIYVFVKGFKFKNEKDKFFSREEVEKAQINTYQKGTVKIEKEKKILPPPPPFDFTTLQIEAYRVYGFLPIKTEEIAQSLYMKAMISYPRTSSQKLPSRLGLKNILEKLAGKSKHSSYIKYLLSNNKVKPREGKKDDVHPAIYPTGEIEKMTEDEEKLYDLILRRFLACFSDPAEIENRKITINAKEKYVAKFIHVVKDGWLSIYNPGIKEDKLPDLKDGEKVEIEKIKISKGKTKPPSRYSPAEIIKKLEQLDIGTKTTRPIILDNLYKRKYIEGEGIRVLPLGKTIYYIFSKYAPEVVDVDLTRKLEREMNEIKDGKKGKIEVINKTKEIVKSIIREMEERKEEIKRDLIESLKKVGIKCICGGELRIISKGGKKFLGCSRYPDCKITYSLPAGNFKLIGKCSKCGSPKVLILGKKKYSFCLNKDCKTKNK